jgi:hypothetical protein
METISVDHSEPTHIVLASFYPGNPCVIIPRAQDRETKAYVRSMGSLETGLSEINVK